MDRAANSRHRPRVLIGRTQDDPGFATLADELAAEGYKTEAMSTSPVGAHSSTRAVTQTLNEFDVVFLVVHGHEGTGPPDSVRAVDQIVREAGVLQGVLGVDQVVLLVEDGVTELSPGGGIPLLRFPAGRPEGLRGDVLSYLRRMFSDKSRNLHRRVPIGEQIRSEELRVPWLLVALILLLAVIPVFVALGSDSKGEAAMSGAQGVVAVPGSRADSFGPHPSAMALHADERAPLGPSTAPSSSDGVQSSVCRLDLTAETLLEDAVTCDGASRLIVEGTAGPWHTQVAAVHLSDGAVGQLEFGREAKGATEVPFMFLGSGTMVLTEELTNLGIQLLTVEFDANDQHVHLFQSDEQGGGVATLTFSAGN